MADLLTLENLFTLLMLLALQAVLGFDNLLYISIESKRAPQEHQRKVRQWGIGIAIVLADRFAVCGDAGDRTVSGQVVQTGDCSDCLKVTSTAIR